MTAADDLVQYAIAYTYADHPVMPATRASLAAAIRLAEAQIVVHEQLRATDLRILKTNLEEPNEPLLTIVVIRDTAPRRATLERKAPKRPHLLRRLWSALR